MHPAVNGVHRLWELPALKFGYQVGGILLWDCAASMDIEDPDVFPCSSAKPVIWLSRMVIGDEGWHLDELEGVWSEQTKLLVVIVTLLPGMFCFCHFISRTDTGRLDQEAAEVDGREDPSSMLV